MKPNQKEGIISIKKVKQNETKEKSSSPFQSMPVCLFVDAGLNVYKDYIIIHPFSWFGLVNQVTNCKFVWFFNVKVSLCGFHCDMERDSKDIILHLCI